MQVKAHASSTCHRIKRVKFLRKASRTILAIQRGDFLCASIRHSRTCAAGGSATPWRASQLGWSGQSESGAQRACQGQPMLSSQPSIRRKQSGGSPRSAISGWLSACFTFSSLVGALLLPHNALASETSLVAVE